jgi:enediyne biosynthesis protein CalE5
MADQAFDPIRFKRQQRNDWDSAATAWRRWWETLERAAQPVSDRMVELAAVNEGQRVLDIATGIGEPAVTAARKTGVSGRVVAIDQAPAMLAIGRQRARQLGLENIDFRESDAEMLELDEGDFDAALCRWGLMFMPDLEAALGRVGGLLKKGGRFAACVWGRPEKVPMISLGAEAVRRLAGVPKPPAGVPDPFRLADTSILEGALESAGFTGATFERITVTFEFASPEAFTDFRQQVSVPFRTMLASKPPELRKEIIDAVAQAARDFAGADGVVRLPSEGICVAAHS